MTTISEKKKLSQATEKVVTKYGKSCHKQNRANPYEIREKQTFFSQLNIY